MDIEKFEAKVRLQQHERLEYDYVGPACHICCRTRKGHPKVCTKKDKCRWTFENKTCNYRGGEGYMHGKEIALRLKYEDVKAREAEHGPELTPVRSFVTQGLCAHAHEPCCGMQAERKKQMKAECQFEPSDLTYKLLTQLHEEGP
jgi:hypothetical protein